jgi:hypothetical protein
MEIMMNPADMMMEVPATESAAGFTHDSSGRIQASARKESYAV